MRAQRVESTDTRRKPEACWYQRHCALAQYHIESDRRTRTDSTRVAKCRVSCTTKIGRILPAHRQICVPACEIEKASSRHGGRAHDDDS